MQEINSIKAAKNIVEVCAKIKRNEKVLIITDFMTFDSAQIIAKVAFALGAEITLAIMSPREYDGEEPTSSIAGGMKNADVILAPVSKSLAHANATKEALANGARFLSLTGLSYELLVSEAFKVDFENQKPMCEKVSDLLNKTNEVIISSPAGTNLRLSKLNRKARVSTGIVEKPGDFSSAPSMVSIFSPLENSTEGIFVSDASIPYFNIGLLSEPAKFEIKKGRVVKIEGGREAEIIKDILEKQNDPSVYNIALLAVGLNPKIRFPVGVLGCNYDEGVFGNVHIGIGTSSNVGGSVKAPIHFDALMHKATMYLDGKIFIKDNNFVNKDIK